MRKNKGFTLIELLAVIVILAIIAVITVPRVAEMIDSSRKGSAEDAFYGAIKAAELGWAKALQKDPATVRTTCTYTNSVVTCTDTNVEISTGGTPPKSGVITLSDDGTASVTGDANALLFNGYKCTGDSTKATCTKVSS